MALLKALTITMFWVYGLIFSGVYAVYYCFFNPEIDGEIREETLIYISMFLTLVIVGIRKANGGI